ncbi:uncharacterized protein LOC135481911 [Liolophura sinensis]|uniref:uncharacterized protein LOC135481911 n=1 Tax=Liolophura sinensis TaxID=3198878 RepID=UPI003157F6F3
MHSGQLERGKEVSITNLPNITVGEVAEFVRQEMIRQYMCAEIDNPFSKLTPGYNNGKAALTLQFHDSGLAKAVVQELDGLNCCGSILNMKIVNDKGFTSKTFSNTSRKNKMAKNFNTGVEKGNEVFVGNVKRDCTEGEFRQFFEDAIHQLVLLHPSDFHLKMNFKPRRPFHFLIFDDPHVASEVVRHLNHVKFKAVLLGCV